MKFSEVIGQEKVKNLLRKEVDEGRVPHAMLFAGPEGCGKLSMAVALGTYLLCQNPHDEDSCGECPACRQIARMGHPDLHFSYPFIKKGEGTTAMTYANAWKEMTRDGFYFGLNDWMSTMGDEAKQPWITDDEADSIVSQLSVTSYEGGYKVMIIWLPERMTGSAANNLLKMLEEPTPKTVFILVSNNTAPILPTILSRTQLIEFPRLTTAEISTTLEKRNGLERNSAMQIARLSNGSYLGALKYININSESDTFFDLFVRLMRRAYMRDVKELQKWSEDIAAWNREKQKSFLAYCQTMLRENFVYNFHQPDLNFMTEREAGFAHNFARFINERNIIDFVREFSRAQKDVEQNVNSRTNFFTLALKVIILIRK